ncbi:MAG: glycosyltransferase family 4 protein [Saprospiraceae bacterium]|nr:glycosyltransferase family 4 protein [Saprospiraceae bacterium]
MNILLIHQTFLGENSGGGSRWNEMTRLWEADGQDVTVIAGMLHHYTGEPFKPEYKGKYVYVDKHHVDRKIIRTHMSGGYAKSFFGRLLGYFSFVFSSIYAGIFVARDKYQVVLTSSPPLFVGISAWILSVIKWKPLVFEVRDLWPESAIDAGVLNNKIAIKLMYMLERFLYRRAKLIIVLTPAFEQKLIEKKGIAPKKVVMIPNAADFSISDEVIKDFDRDAFRAKMGWTDKVVITYVGAHGVANHLIQMVETAELLRDKPEVHFVLLGDGMQKPMLKEEVQKRGLTNVEFIDYVPKRVVFEYIRASDFGTSVLKKADTFKTVYSNKTFDYMSCKLPILMVIDGVSRQLVEDAGCGVYVRPEDPADYAQKIREYLAMDRAIWAEQGEAGYVYAKKHFDRMVLSEKYLECLAGVIAKKA